MNEYNLKRNYDDGGYTTVVTSYSLMPPAKSIEDIRTGNFWVPVAIRLPLV